MNKKGQLESLINYYTDGNKTQFANMLGIKPQTVNSWFLRDTFDLELIYSKCIDISSDWLLTGEGEMLKSERPQIEEGTEGIPLLPVKAQGGSLNGFAASPMLYECERIVCPIGGVDFAMTISGESMYPEYPNGSQIFVKKVNEKAFIEWGKCYVLDTCNGAVIKILVPGADESKVKCLSVNKDERYAPFEVAWKDVFGVYRVVLCMQVK
jgi:phage repressor protein C with HTH and peptisase S24 domain